MGSDEKKRFRDQQRAILEEIQKKRHLMESPRAEEESRHAGQGSETPGFVRVPDFIFPWHNGCTLVTHELLGASGYARVFEAAAWCS